MSDLTARVTASDRTFHVEGYERISYDLTYVEGVFDVGNTELADAYRRYGRTLMVIDEVVYDLYRDSIDTYFDQHGIALTVIGVHIHETAKSLETFERIVTAFDEFGLVRTEPVLVVGGGLTTDVAGFACASYRRNTPYIRIPTTLIGLIDASVSIKVAVNHGRHKNRLGAYHASQQVFLDFSFLKTLPEDQIRNGMAELIKIRSSATPRSFSYSRRFGPELLSTRFGHLGGTACAASHRAPADLRRRSRPCSSWRRPICTRSTWTGSSRSGTHGARPGADAAHAVLPRARDQHGHGAVGHARRTPRAASPPAGATACWPR